MTVKDLHKILEDMMNAGLEDLEIRCTSDCSIKNEIVDVSFEMDEEGFDVSIWWG